MEEAEEQLQAMDTAWGGAAAPPQDEAQGEAGPSQPPAAPEAPQGGSAVNMDEATAAVEQGTTHRSGGGGSGGGSGGGAKRQQVVVEADRTSFERILLMPDMLNDHLPDRILEALQRL